MYQDKKKYPNLNGDVFTASAAAKMQEALMRSAEEIRLIMEREPEYNGNNYFMSTPKSTEWIQESTMQPDNLAQHSESVRMAGKFVNKMKIVTSGVDIQDAINNAYTQLEGIARSFGAHMPSSHQVSMKTTQETPVKPDSATFLTSEDYYLAMNKYYREMGQIEKIGTRDNHTYDFHAEAGGKAYINGKLYVGDDPTAYMPQIPMNGFGTATDGTTWQVAGNPTISIAPITSTTTAHWPPNNIQTVTTNGTAQYPFMNAFPRKEQLGSVGFYVTFDSQTNVLNDVTTQVQYFPNPMDVEKDTEKTEPLVEQHDAWYFLDQNTICTNGYYTLHPTNIDTLHVYDDNRGDRVLLSTCPEKKDRYNELKNLSSGIHYSKFNLDNTEWIKVV